MNKNKTTMSFRTRLHEIIFEADTPGGKLFDVLLILSIIISVILVMLDSVSAVQQSCGKLLYIGEWFFTILFTVEYILRLYSIRRPMAYATSFFGMVDLLASPAASGSTPAVCSTRPRPRVGSAVASAPPMGSTSIPLRSPRSSCPPPRGCGRPPAPWRSG